MNAVWSYIARGTLVLVDAARKMQGLQLRLTAGEVKDGVEHFEPYGFTSHPKAGAEAVLGFVGGDRSHCIALIVGDRRYRLAGLESGEVAIYTDEGDSLVFKRGNRVELTTKDFVVNATDSVQLHAGVEILLDAPQVTGTGALSNAGSVTMTGGLAVSGGGLTHEGKNVGDDHAHDGVVSGGDVSGGPV